MNRIRQNQQKYVYQQTKYHMNELVTTDVEDSLQQHNLSMKQVTIKSSAFPSSKDDRSKLVPQPQVSSSVHQLLKRSKNPYKNGIKIRNFIISDLQQLKKLQNEWFPIKYKQGFYRKIIQKQVHCYVAQTTIQIMQQNQQIAQKIIIGAVVFQITDSQGYLKHSWVASIFNIFAQAKDSIYILTLGVIDQYRQKGIGKLFIQHLFQLTHQYKNIQLIYLHVVNYNEAAISFYRKNNFKQLQNMKNYYHIAGQQYDGSTYGIFLNNGQQNSKVYKWFNSIFR